MTTPNFLNSGFIQILGGGAAPPNTPLCYGPGGRCLVGPTLHYLTFHFGQNTYLQAYSCVNVTDVQFLSCDLKFFVQQDHDKFADQ